MSHGTTQSRVPLFLPLLAALVLAGCPQQEHQADWKSVVYSSRESDTGAVSLKANGWLCDHFGESRLFVLQGVWRFDPTSNKWSRTKLSTNEAVTIKPEKRTVYSEATDQKLVELTKDVGLFWVQWGEGRRHESALVCSGPVLCNDIEIGEPPKGMIAACVPFVDHAEATFVPDPKVHCRD